MVAIVVFYRQPCQWIRMLLKNPKQPNLTILTCLHLACTLYVQIDILNIWLVITSTSYNQLAHYIYKMKLTCAKLSLFRLL
jgi:hypothetical protein